MPLYIFSTPTDFPAELRAGVAEAITSIHCQLTGAPITFVNVVFNQGIALDTAWKFHVLGNIRKGRNQALQLELQQTLDRRLGALLDVKQSARKVELTEIPASWVMEGGVILPEPGSIEERLWNSSET